MATNNNNNSKVFGDRDADSYAKGHGLGISGTTKRRAEQSGRDKKKRKLKSGNLGALVASHDNAITNGNMAADRQRGGEEKFIGGHMPAQHAVGLRVYDETLDSVLAEALGQCGDGGERASEAGEQLEVITSNVFQEQHNADISQAPNIGHTLTLGSTDSITSRDSEIQRLLQAVHTAQRLVENRDGTIRNLLNGIQIRDQEGCNTALQRAIDDGAKDLVAAQDEKAACITANNRLKTKLFKAEMTSSFCKHDNEKARRALQTENIRLNGTIAGKERELQTSADVNEMMRKQIIELTGRVTAAEMYQQWSTS
ncbi:hypothetical protein LTR56_022651 [Elasticomyces elasticus]|nr:hypothetical protein LTR56_022651 [Elasticomyces elasticus]KAK3624247.1 hypothetical protein LTR22_024041 [Elasticomyces elasticus]KAK4921896.1 hypothetical protein LTR49_010669 [Elasticomyces elasticus]KAK5758108.1 hypothetical protein LTS12_011724 [Elasticomyces elasticus]